MSAISHKRVLKKSPGRDVSERFSYLDKATNIERCLYPVGVRWFRVSGVLSGPFTILVMFAQPCK